MDVYLVKEEAKIIKVSEAFSETKRSSGYLKTLTVSNLPVAFESAYSDASWKSGGFVVRVESMIKKNHNDRFGNLKLELIISKGTSPVSNSMNGYFVISSESREESKLNVLKLLDKKLENNRYFIDYSVKVELGHLATANGAVSPDNLVCLKATGFKCVIGSSDQLRSHVSFRVPPEVRRWWEQGTTGFIYSKSSVKFTSYIMAVDRIYGSSNGNEALMNDGDFKDVKIKCLGGQIVRCHRAVLANKSKFFRAKLKKMLAEGEKIGPWKLDMEISREGMEAFLEYVYCGRVNKGIWGCYWALVLLMAAREYQVVGLEQAMQEIIMGKGSSDFVYFSVEGALDLFLYGRAHLEDLKHLRDKAVRVLQSYLKTKSDEILKSKEYQDLFKNEPKIAMELSSLYTQLS